MENKIFNGAKEALEGLLFNGMKILSGGFGLCGIAENSIMEIQSSGVKDLRVVSNNVGNQGQGLAHLLKTNQIAHATCSYVGGNPLLEKMMIAGEIEVELNPQGTLCERLRAGGSGIPAFYTPTGVGTLVASGKETRFIGSKLCILEKAIQGDLAIVKAEFGDSFGNLVFKEAARNFNPLMAMAGKVTVAEVEKLVPIGSIPAQDVHLPGIFVQRIFEGASYKNAIEFVKNRAEV